MIQKEPKITGTPEEVANEKAFRWLRTRVRGLEMARVWDQDTCKLAMSHLYKLRLSKAGKFDSFHKDQEEDTYEPGRTISTI